MPDRTDPPPPPCPAYHAGAGSWPQLVFGKGVGHVAAESEGEHLADLKNKGVGKGRDFGSA